jgi:hypothetical protein
VLTFVAGAVVVGALLTAFGRPAPARARAAVTPPSSATAEMVKTINAKLEEGWKANKLTPSRTCDDYEFIRRASLDIIGRIARPEEIDTFFKDPPATRRARLIERLLASEEYPRHWANMWSNWLLTRSGPFGSGKYKEQTQVWLEDQFAENKPYDKVVYALLTATGKNSENGAVNFILAHVGLPNPQARQQDEGEFDFVPITSRTTRLFLGIQTQCTQCHDHPFDKHLLQPHFWGINAYFRQVQRIGTPPAMDGNQRGMEGPTLELRDNAQFDPDALVFYETRSGKELQTRATFLNGTKLSMKDGSAEPISGLDRRVELATRILEHPTFAKAYVNRVWAHFFGRGFTNPIDDFNDQNEPTNPELLDGLAGAFKNYGYNQKDLIRWICNSRAYGLSSVANKTNDKPEVEPLFSRMPLKALSPEVLFESLMTATDSDKSKAARKALRTKWLSNLIANFGDDEGNEVVFNATVVQALMMMNSADINDAIAPKEAGKGTVAKVMAKRTGSGRMIVHDLYIAALNRPPTAAEYAKIEKAIGGGPPAWKYQDLFWALLNSNEFILNH